MLKFGFTFRFFVGVLSDGGQCCLRKESAESVGRVFLGRDVAFSGSVGCCGIAHDSQRLECPEGVWAVQRALLLPF